MAIPASGAIARNLEQLEKQGYLLVRAALDRGFVARWRECLMDRWRRGYISGETSVGNVYFERLLAEEPDLTRPLIGHPSVAPYLKGLLGRQCQLRSLRAHINPAEYIQEWHMDFFDYWFQEEKSGARHPVAGLCINTTFYLTDNPPDRGRLRFIRDYVHRPIPEELRPHQWYTDDRSNPFQRWCDQQPFEDLHPMAGDAIIFLSHVPHQGAKVGDDPPDEARCNIVLHYQQNPMHPGIAFVSSPQFTLETLGYDGTFPFAKIDADERNRAAQARRDDTSGLETAGASCYS